MIKSNKHFDKQVATVYGKVTFDNKGESNDLSETQQKGLSKLPEFTYVEDKKPEPEKKEPAKKTTSTAAKKTTTTRKTPAKKTTSTKTEK